MKKIYSLFLTAACAFILNAQATIITEWNFNDQTTNPSVGIGELTLIGGIMPWDNPSDDIPSGYSSGCNPGTLLLEDGPAIGNWAYNTTAYPEQGSNPDTAGFLFHTSTEDAVDEVSFIFNLRRSGTASVYFSVYSSTNGTDWNWIATESNETTDFGTYGGPYLVPNGTDAPELYIKVVSSFAPDTNEYISTAGNYGVNGTIRLDNVRVFTGTLSVEEINDQSVISNTIWNSHVTFNAIGKANVDIYNLAGQKFKSYLLNGATTINVSDLPKGIYVIHFTEKGRSISQKVVKK